MNRKFLTTAAMAVAVIGGASAVSPAAQAVNVPPVQNPVEVTISTLDIPNPGEVVASLLLTGDGLGATATSITIDENGRWSRDGFVDGYESAPRIGQLSDETFAAWQRMATSEELAQERLLPIRIAICASPRQLIIVKAGDVVVRTFACSHRDSVPPMARRLLDFSDRILKGEQPGKGTAIALRHGSDTVTVLPEGSWTITRRHPYSLIPLPRTSLLHLPPQRLASGWLTDEQNQRLQQLVAGQEFHSEAALANRDGVPSQGADEAHLEVNDLKIQLPSDLTDPVMLPILNEINRILTEATHAH